VKHINGTEIDKMVEKAEEIFGIAKCEWYSENEAT